MGNIDLGGDGPTVVEVPPGQQPMLDES